MNSKFQDFKTRLTEINDLKAANAILSWDQMTLMPPGGAAARGRQMATLEQLAHEKFINPEVGKLLEELQPMLNELPPDSPEAALIKLTTRDYEKAVKIPGILYR